MTTAEMISQIHACAKKAERALDGATHDIMAADVRVISVYADLMMQAHRRSREPMPTGLTFDQAAVWNANLARVEAEFDEHLRNIRRITRMTIQAVRARRAQINPLSWAALQTIGLLFAQSDSEAADHV